MALKVKLPSGMRTIDSLIHKPVTFVSGQKKILDKGITFVNGVKKYLWGKDGIPVDYIKTDGISNGGVYAIAENWMHTSNNGQAMQFDISNLDNPDLVQSIAWGTVFQYCGFQCTGNNLVYGTSVGNKLVVDSTTGNVAVTANYPVMTGQVSSGGATGNALACMTNNYLCGFSATFSSGSTANIFPGNEWYWNNVKKYETSKRSDPLRDNGTPAIQIGTDSFIKNLVSTGHHIQPGLFLATPNNITRVGGLMNDLLMLDGDTLCGVTNFTAATSSTFKLYDKTTYAVVKTYTHSETDEQINLLGRIGDYYYLVATPKTDALDGAKVLLLDKDTFDVIWTQTLESDPFGEYEGKTTFWRIGSTLPQVSKTGFLALNTYSNSKFRCARFGELL